ncbi:MAG: hypothetical protein ABI610_08875, partial [Acidobacteriota bacterium]
EPVQGGSAQRVSDCLGVRPRRGVGVTEKPRGDIESQPMEDVRLGATGGRDDRIRRGDSRSPPGEVGISVAIKGECESEDKSTLFGWTQSVLDCLFPGTWCGMSFRGGHPDIEPHPSSIRLLVAELDRQRVLTRDRFSLDRKAVEVDRRLFTLGFAPRFQAGRGGGVARARSPPGVADRKRPSVGYRFC